MAASAKTDAKEASAPAATSSAGAGGKSKGASWLPAIVVILAAPAASWAVTQFVLLPKLERKLSLPAAAVAAAPAAGGKADAKGPVAPPTYDFKDMVVNLAGTMGTRYLKTSFVVSGSDADLHAAFEDKKTQLTDVTINVLESLTLADLEEPGAKNVLREKLVTAYNQALGRKLAEQVYFTDFVVQ